MPVRSGWIIATSVAAVVSIVHPASAEPAGAIATDCQDRFRLDRRDNPDNAIKNFHQCTAIQSVSLTLENFTFWYVTLPDKSHAGDDSWFTKVYRDDAAILASPAVALSHQQAVAVLDDSILRGLKRGKRDDLASKWLANHNPQIIAGGAAAPAPESAKATNISATPPSATANANTALPPSTMAEPKVAPPKIAEVLPPPKAAQAAPSSEPAKRVYHNVRPRQYRAAPNGGLAANGEPSAGQLNRAEPIGGWYTPAVPGSIPQAYYPAGAMPPPPYYATVLQPPAPYPPPAPTMYTSASPTPRPQQVALPAPAPLQPQYAPSTNAAATATAPPAQYPAQYLAQYPVRTIGQQIDFNLRTITGLINSNIATIQATFFGWPPTYPAR